MRMSELKPSALNALRALQPPCASSVSESTDLSKRPRSFSHQKVFRLKLSPDLLVPVYLVTVAGAFMQISGGIWDVSSHIMGIVERFFAAPHLVLYAGLVSGCQIVGSGAGEVLWLPLLILAYSRACACK